MAMHTAAPLQWAQATLARWAQTLDRSPDDHLRPTTTEGHATMNAQATPHAPSHDTQARPFPETLKRWAIVELFGHTRLAGAVSEETFAGAGLMRIDVPEVAYSVRDYSEQAGTWLPATRTIPAHTCCYGGSAIFSIKWVDEATALLAAHQIRHEPIRAYELRTALEGLTLGDRRALLGPAGSDDDQGAHG